MKAEQRDYVQNILNKVFPELSLDPAHIQELEMDATVIDFPRSLFCTCSKCTSTWLVKAILGYNVTLRTAERDYQGWLPGPDDALSHI